MLTTDPYRVTDASQCMTANRISFWLDVTGSKIEYSYGSFHFKLTRSCTLMSRSCSIVGIFEEFDERLRFLDVANRTSLIFRSGMLLNFFEKS